MTGWQRGVRRIVTLNDMTNRQRRCTILSGIFYLQNSSISFSVYSFHLYSQYFYCRYYYQTIPCHIHTSIHTNIPLSLKEMRSRGNPSTKFRPRTQRYAYSYLVQGYLSCVPGPQSSGDISPLSTGECAVSDIFVYCTSSPTCYVCSPLAVPRYSSTAIHT